MVWFICRPFFWWFTCAPKTSCGPYNVSCISCSTNCWTSSSTSSSARNRPPSSSWPVPPQILYFDCGSTNYDYFYWNFPWASFPLCSPVYKLCPETRLMFLLFSTCTLPQLSLTIVFVFGVIVSRVATCEWLPDVWGSSRWQSIFLFLKKFRSFLWVRCFSAMWRSFARFLFFYWRVSSFCRDCSGGTSTELWINAFLRYF